MADSVRSHVLAPEITLVVSPQLSQYPVYTKVFCGLSGPCKTTDCLSAHVGGGL